MTFLKQDALKCLLFLSLVWNFVNVARDTLPQSTLALPAKELRASRSQRSLSDQTPPKPLNKEWIQASNVEEKAGEAAGIQATVQLAEQKASGEAGGLLMDKDGTISYLFIVERMGSDYWSCHYRVMQIAEALRLNGRAVTMVIVDECPTYQFLRRLVARGVEVECLGEVEDKSIAYLLQRKPHAVALMMLWFFAKVNLPERYGSEILQHSPQTQTVIVTDDYHWLREHNLELALEDREPILTWEAHRAIHARTALSSAVELTKRRELQAYCEAHAVATITPEDAFMIRTDLPFANVSTVRMATLHAPKESGYAGFAERQGVLFVGNGFNPTNFISIEWLFETVVPLVWAQPGGSDLRFTLVGSLPEKAAGWSPLAQEDPRVVSTGRVRDMDPYLHAARVFVSPIVVGTGLNVKNLVALEYGIPIVTTIIGAEGLRLVDAVNHTAKAFIATSAQEMADAIVQLHSNATTWERYHSYAVQHAREHFNLRKVGEDLLQLEAMLSQGRGAGSGERQERCAAYLSEALRLREAAALAPEILKLKAGRASAAEGARDERDRAAAARAEGDGYRGDAFTVLEALLAAVTRPSAAGMAWVLLAAGVGVALGLGISERDCAGRRGARAGRGLHPMGRAPGQQPGAPWGWGGGVAGQQSGRQRGGSSGGGGGGASNAGAQIAATVQGIERSTDLF